MIVILCSYNVWSDSCIQLFSLMQPLSDQCIQLFLHVAFFTHVGFNKTCIQFFQSCIQLFLLMQPLPDPCVHIFYSCSLLSNMYSTFIIHVAFLSDDPCYSALPINKPLSDACIQHFSLNASTSKAPYLLECLKSINVFPHYQL